MIKRLTLRIKSNLYNRIRIYAEDNDITITAAIKRMIIKFLDDINK